MSSDVLDDRKLQANESDQHFNPLGNEENNSTSHVSPDPLIAPSANGIIPIVNPVTRPPAAQDNNSAQIPAHRVHVRRASVPRTATSIWNWPRPLWDEDNLTEHSANSRTFSDTRASREDTRPWVLAAVAVLTGIAAVALLIVAAVWTAKAAGPSRLLDNEAEDEEMSLSASPSSAWAGRVWGCGKSGRQVQEMPRWTDDWLRQGRNKSVGDADNSQVFVALGDWGQPSPAQARTARDIAQLLRADLDAQRPSDARTPPSTLTRSISSGSATASPTPSSSHPNTASGGGNWTGMFTTARVSLSLGDHRYPGGVENWMDDQVTRTAQMYKTAGSKDTGVSASPLPSFAQAHTRPFIAAPYYAVDTTLSPARGRQAYQGPWQRWLMLDTNALACAERQWAAPHLNTALAHEQRAGRAPAFPDVAGRPLHWQFRPHAPFSAYPDAKSAWLAFTQYRAALASALRARELLAAHRGAPWSREPDIPLSARVLAAESEAAWTATLAAVGESPMIGYEAEDCARVQPALTAATLLELPWEAVCAPDEALLRTSDNRNATELPVWLQWLQRRAPGAGEGELPAACALRGATDASSPELLRFPADDVAAVLRVAVAVAASALGQGDGTVAWDAVMSDDAEVTDQEEDIHLADLSSMSLSPTLDGGTNHRPWWRHVWVWAAALLADSNSDAVQWLATAHDAEVAAADSEAACVLRELKNQEIARPGGRRWVLRVQGGVAGIALWAAAIARECSQGEKQAMSPETVLSLAALRAVAVEAAHRRPDPASAAARARPLSMLPAWLAARIRLAGVRRQVHWAEHMVGVGQDRMPAAAAGREEGGGGGGRNGGHGAAMNRNEHALFRHNGAHRGASSDAAMLHRDLEESTSTCANPRWSGIDGESSPFGAFPDAASDMAVCPVFLPESCDSPDCGGTTPLEVTDNVSAPRNLRVLSTTDLAPAPTDLAPTPATPRIVSRAWVVAHHPLLSMGPHRSHLQLVALLGRVLRRRAVRAWLAAHDHLLAHLAVARWCDRDAAECSLGGTEVLTRHVSPPYSAGVLHQPSSGAVSDTNEPRAISSLPLLGTDPLHVIVSGGGGWRPNKLLMLSIPQPLTPTVASTHNSASAQPNASSTSANARQPVPRAINIPPNALAPAYTPAAGASSAWSRTAIGWSLQALETCGVRPARDTTAFMSAVHGKSPVSLVLPPLVPPLGAAEAAAGVWWRPPLPVMSQDAALALRSDWPLASASAADMVAAQRAVAALVNLGTRLDGKGHGSAVEGSVPLGLTLAVAETLGYAVLRVGADGVDVALVSSGDKQRYSKGWSSLAEKRSFQNTEMKHGRIIHQVYIPYD